MAYLDDYILPTTPKMHHLSPHFTDLRLYLPSVAFEGNTVAERKTFSKSIAVNLVK
jgi:hypothetical protein